MEQSELRCSGAIWVTRDCRTTWKLFPICYWRKLEFRIHHSSSYRSDSKSRVKKEKEKIIQEIEIFCLSSSSSANSKALSSLIVWWKWMENLGNSAVDCCNVCIMTWHIYLCFQLFPAKHQFVLSNIWWDSHHHQQCRSFVVVTAIRTLNISLNSEERQMQKRAMHWRWGRVKEIRSKRTWFFS